MTQFRNRALLTPLLLVLLVSCSPATSGTAGSPIAAPAPAAKQDSTRAATCPSVLMFDGLQINKDNNDEKAKYWGQFVGVDGFFVNLVFTTWSTSVGDDENSPRYRGIKRFQERFARYGVSQNFLKVAIWQPVHWDNPKELDKYVNNFREAAHLARFAGLQGIALDLEPYPYTSPLWKVDPRQPHKGDVIEQTGKRIGEAIEQGYPGSPVFAIREVLYWWNKGADNYALSNRFWNGLMEARIPTIYVGNEMQYPSDPGGAANQLKSLYDQYDFSHGFDSSKVEMSPGIWPLGKSQTDKSARLSSGAFRNELDSAFSGPWRYVWIYGFSSAWETNGAYAAGAVVSDFGNYIGALKSVKNACPR